MPTSYRCTSLACHMSLAVMATISCVPSLLFITFQERFGISLGDVALLIAVTFAAKCVTIFLSALWADDIGHRAVIMTGNLLAALCFFCMGLLPFLMRPMTGLLISSILGGLGAGMIEALTDPIFEALPGEHKPSAISRLHSCFCWGTAGGVLLSTLYFTLFSLESWRWLMLFWALPPLMTVLLFSRAPILELPGHGEKGKFRMLLGQRGFIVLLVMMFCAGGVEHTLLEWLSEYAEAGLGVSKTMGDMLGPGLFALTLGVSRLIFGLWGRGRGVGPFVAASAYFCVVCVLLAVCARGAALALLGCALSGFAVGMLWPGTLSLAAGMYERGGTAMFSLLALGGSMGGALAPALAGLVANSGAAPLTDFFQAGLTPLRLGLREGMLTAAVYPVVMIICLVLRQKHMAAKD